MGPFYLETARPGGFDPKSGLSPQPQIIVRALVGVGCFGAGLTLVARGGPFGVSLGAAAVQWISCAGLLTLLAQLDRHVQESRPGIRSLFHTIFHVALAGSSLSSAASLSFFLRLGAAPILAAALAGLASTLLSAMLLEWLLRDVDWDGPLPNESAVMARLTALQEIVRRCA